MNIEFIFNKAIVLTAIHIVSARIACLRVDTMTLSDWKVAEGDLDNASLFQEHLYFDNTKERNIQLTLTFKGELKQLEAFTNVLGEAIQVYSSCAYYFPEKYGDLQKLDYVGIMAFRNQLLEFIPGETRKGCFYVLDLPTKSTKA